MSKDISSRLQALRSHMASNGIDAAIIPQTDPHQSEYIADHWQLRRFLSGFTGSAGTLVVTADKAALWTDSRYFIQAAKQLADTEIDLMKDGLETTPSITEFLASNLKPGAKVGCDGMLMSVARHADFAKEIANAGLQLDIDFEPGAPEVWPDRPALPKCKVFVHEEKYAGQSAKEKLAEIREKALQQGAYATLLSALDEIAWTLNIRSSDVKYNPVATAYLYIAPDKATLLIDEDKITPEVRAYLQEQGVEVKPYTAVKEFVANGTKGKVLVDENRTSATINSLLGKNALKGDNGVAVHKGVKNAAQVEGIRNAMVRDGVALVKAFMELENTLAKGEKATELDMDALLRKYRSQQDMFVDESFGSIVGFGPNGAIVHYEPTEESFAEIGPRGLLLVDSGAQYLDGTTDITRTVAIGEPTAEEKTDFTLVLKGHIILGTAVYPAGTRGDQLDALARMPLWQHGMSYLHGTGHGVGHFLNVHEGPQSIRLNHNPQVLLEGMITSNEPGVYKEGKHGVRCENLVLTVPAMENEFGKFCKFETLTLFPFDLKLVDKSLLSPEEIAWLNDYHKTVYDSLSPYLSAEECKWLADQTKEIKKTPRNVSILLPTTQKNH